MRFSGCRYERPQAENISTGRGPRATRTEIQRFREELVPLPAVLGARRVELEKDGGGPHSDFPLTITIREVYVGSAALAIKFDEFKLGERGDSLR